MKKYIGKIAFKVKLKRLNVLLIAVLVFRSENKDIISTGTYNAFMIAEPFIKI